jgi:hypothetical protein
MNQQYLNIRSKDDESVWWVILCICTGEIVGLAVILALKYFEKKLKVMQQKKKKNILKIYYYSKQ